MLQLQPAFGVAALLAITRLPTDALNQRSRWTILFVVCGLANFGSLRIMVDGLGTMAREQRNEIHSLGLKSIDSGTLTASLMGAIVRVLS